MGTTESDETQSEHTDESENSFNVMIRNVHICQTAEKRCHETSTESSTTDSSFTSSGEEKKELKHKKKRQKDDKPKPGSLKTVPEDK